MCSWTVSVRSASRERADPAGREDTIKFFIISCGNERRQRRILQRNRQYRWNAWYARRRVPWTR